MTGAIPLIEPFFGDEEAAAAVEAIRSGWVAQGPKVAEFESAFAETVGAAGAVAVSSATAGLHLAMVALGVEPGDEVIVPSLSFIATANAAAYVGAVPVFADVDPTTFNLTPGTIEAALTERTRAVIVVHQLGMPADLDAIHELCRTHGVAVVEDAACAIGSTYRSRRVGSHSPIVVFSLHPRKLLTTGEGGMVAVDDLAMATRIARLRQHGMSVPAHERAASGDLIVEEYVELGYNYRLTDIQAAIGLVQLSRLDAVVARRRDLAAVYEKAFIQLPGVAVPGDPPHGTTNFQTYWLRIGAEAATDRDAVLSALRQAGIGAKPALMAAHLEPAYRGRRHLPLTETERIHGDALALPMFHRMDEDQQERVIAVVAESVSP